ncbi:MAG TPA: EAL domain-containing protein, partial [Acidimicrobiales bacterium]|nr:EAL domain-containing protein [Acidimicrobiales bacterium]
ERREMRQRLEHNAIHDSLTGLPNRLLFSDRLEVALSHAGRSGSKVAVIFCDLDRFMWINDSLGHEAGDRVLAKVAERLRAVVRQSDTLARIGGDEFTLLCEVSDRAQALEVAERVAACMQLPLRLDGSEVYVTASLGVAVSAGGSETAEQLLRQADLAMYKAKELGRARVELYEEDDAALSVTRLQMGTELHGAVKRCEFELHYQPLVDLHGRAVLGVEALVRWRHPRRGLLLPAQFIPLAEDSGIMIPLGAWVLHRACADSVRWGPLRAAAGCRSEPFAVAVNVSALQLSDKGIPAQVAEVLADTGANPDQVWLEITESALMRHPEEAARQLAELRSLGVHLAVDDFGTGYSSLAYLRSFPVEALKIDRSFVEDLGRDPKSAAIVRAVVELAEALGVAPLAEGVERLSQASELKALGCNLAQGYLFCEPRPFREPDEFPTDDLASFASARAPTLASAG